MVGAVLALQAMLWLAVGLPPRRLLRAVGKLWGFALFVLISYALTRESPEIDRWIAIGSWHQAINVGALPIAALMLMRIVAVILASQIVRVGDPRAIAQGL